MITVCGLPERVEEGLLAAIAEAASVIDLRAHRGVHPRVGAADVVPLVPLAGSLQEAAEDARRLAGRVWRELRLPVYLYGAAVGGPSLADIRAGRARLDLGSAPHPAAGAVCIGARRALVAYNVLLPGASREAALDLARSLRASAPGGLPGVQALAFRLTSGSWQLSMNLFDLAATPPAAVLAEVGRRAATRGLEPGADEVVGLCPAAFAVPAAAGRILEAREAAAVAGALGENRLADRLAATSAARAAFADAAGEARGLVTEEPQLRAARDHAAAALAAAADL